MIGLEHNVIRLQIESLKQVEMLAHQIINSTSHMSDLCEAQEGQGLHTRPLQKLEELDKIHARAFG
jgi:hypothetical protein